MNTIRLSILVAVYGVEKYIDKFCASLIPNLGPGVEVVLVDDGAKDKSGEIAEAFAEKYSEFVKVIHKENGGVASARNRGLEVARGEYIVFADPDDYLAEDYCKSILDAIVQFDKPDMLLMDYYECVNGQCVLKSLANLIAVGEVSKISYLREFVKNKAFDSFLWSKVIKRDLWKGRRFDESLKVFEDFDILTEISLDYQKIIYLKIPLYYYVKRKSSLTNTMDVSMKKSNFSHAKERYERYEKFLKECSINAPVEFCFELLKVSYVSDEYVDGLEAERFIKDNIFKILFDSSVDFVAKKNSILLICGLLKPYYRHKYGRNKV